MARMVIPNAILDVSRPTSLLDAGYDTLRVDQVKRIRLEGEPLVQVVNLSGHCVSWWVKSGRSAYTNLEGQVFDLHIRLEVRRHVDSKYLSAFR